MRAEDPRDPAGRCRLLPLPMGLFHLLAAPLLAAVAWAGVSWWAASRGVVIGAQQKTGMPTSKAAMATG